MFQIAKEMAEFIAKFGLSIIGTFSWQNLLMPYANNKGAGQPVHLGSLISTFVVRFLDVVQYLYLLNPKFQDFS